MKLNRIIREDIDKVYRDIKFFKTIFKNKNILLVGASSFILSYLIILLVDKKNLLNCNIFLCGRNKNKIIKKFNFLNLKSKNIFVVSFNELHKIKYKFNFIIHAASNPNSNFLNNPIEVYEANILWTHELLKLAKRDKSTFIFFSSSEVYGNFNTNRILKTTDVTNSNSNVVQSIYPDSKRLAETICLGWSKKNKVKTIIIRLFHTYGPFINIEDGRIFSDIIKNLLNNKPFVLQNLTNKRCFCYATDFLKAFLLIISKSKKNFNIHNLGNIYQEFSIEDLLKEIKAEFKELNISIHKAKLKNKDINKLSIKRSRPDIEPLLEYGWKPEITVRQGFRRTYNYFVDIKKKVK